MQSKFNELKVILNEIADLTSAASVLSWDQQTHMPPGGSEGRGHALAALRRLSHSKFIAPRVGQLLESLQSDVEKLDPTSDAARLVRVTQRKYQKQVRVPAEWVADFTRITSAANRA